MTTETTPPPARRRAVWPHWLLGLALAGGAGWWLDARLHDVGDRLQQVERAIQLYRFEQTSNAGLGIEALLEKLGHWAPQLDSAMTPAAELPLVEGRIRELLEAVRGLGPSAGPEIERRYHAAGGDELRKWLLRAALAADPPRGKELLVRTLRALEFKASQRLREFAADALLEIDRPAAGTVLRDILGYESSVGIDERRIPREYLERFPEALFAHAGGSPGFFNFIPRYVASGDPAREETLIMLLSRQGHDLLTVQECVKQLGAMRSRAAAPKIQQLYDSPPEITQNPIFQRHCLDAIAECLGKDACDWLAEKQRAERNELLAAKLTELRQRLCR
jgi:hypothetical protein